MNIVYEKIETFEPTLNQETFKEEFKNIESDLTDVMRSYLRKALVECVAYGKGVVIDIVGDSFADLITNIDFSGEVRQFMLNHIATQAKFVIFKNPEITETYNKAWVFYQELLSQFNKYENAEKQAIIDKEKKAEEERKFEAKHNKQKEKAIKDFEDFVANRLTAMPFEEEFYYALGWLTNHIGTVNATIPDYLEEAFIKHFGPNAPYKVVDSKHIGRQPQQSWSFKVTLKKPETAPACLTKHLNSTGKAITNIGFIWDLIDGYGFKFGKTQDVDNIRQNIPAHDQDKYISSFEDGLKA